MQQNDISITKQTKKQKKAENIIAYTSSDEEA